MRSGGFDDESVDKPVGVAYLIRAMQNLGHSDRNWWWWTLTDAGG
jgi:hypothetical protein